MPRPPKEEPDKRDRWLKVRVNEAEELDAKALAKAEKRPVSEVLREMLKQRAAAPVRAVPALSAKELAELSRIGNNLNQLTRVANASQSLPAGLDEVARELIPYLKKAMRLRLRED